MQSIFEYQDYIELIRDLISAKPHNGRGVQTALAKELGCQQAYLSKVISKNADLNFDQGSLVCKYFNLNDIETDYFLSLLMLNRSYSRHAKEYWNKKISNLQRERQDLKTRLGVSSELEPEDKATYYSDWTYASVHVLTSNSKFNTVETIARRLKIDEPRVASVLAFLEKTGLVVKKQNQYFIGKKTIHIGADNALVVNHHRNWRLKAMDALNSSRDNLHYSSVITCAEADRVKIKETLIRAIEEIRSIVKKSSEESVYAYGVDFFDL